MFNSMQNMQIYFIAFRVLLAGLLDYEYIFRIPFFDLVLLYARLEARRMVYIENVF